KKTEIEASGNMTLERVKTLSSSGVDYISVGELTHTVKIFDFSLINNK
ncbi:MAG: nicotinate-nucleotide diphosphorylase (carboxylating), partial [Spirochaetales bacterium]|nr:nicotinate-nucleotide diphosphorylase (carboxylating) [Spirochaetales bacterium]